MKTNILILSALLSFFAANAQKIPSWKINDVADYYNKKNDSVYVINFWATFCKPCIIEIPYLQSIARKYESQKVRLLLISLDLPAFYPHKIKNFVRKNNYTADIIWLNESDASHFGMIDPSWDGSMPATLFINAATGYKKFIGSAVSEEQFEKELRRAIGRD